MQFLYHPNAKDALIELDSKNTHYLLKVRRMRIGEAINVRNLKDDMLYTYSIQNLHKNLLTLCLDSKKSAPSVITTRLHLLWAIIEPKVIEKALPLLNELGVWRISFFYAQYSQQHFTLNMQRMQHILIQSCQQCGRSSLMELDVFRDFESICETFSDFYAFDFGGEDCRDLDSIKADIRDNIWRVMIGTEGGFSPKERARFAKIITLNDTLILRSESACAFVASMAKMM